VYGGGFGNPTTTTLTENGKVIGRGIITKTNADGTIETIENVATNVKVSGGTFNSHIYGGGHGGQIIGTTNFEITGGTFKGYVYGGGNGLTAAYNHAKITGTGIIEKKNGDGTETITNVATNFKISGTPIFYNFVIGGNYVAPIEGTTNFEITGGTFGSSGKTSNVAGGSYLGPITGTGIIEKTNGDGTETITNVATNFKISGTPDFVLGTVTGGSFGTPAGGNIVRITGCVNFEIAGGNLGASAIYGGACHTADFENGAENPVAINLKITGGSISNIFGGGGTSMKRLADGTQEVLYSEITGDININISDNAEVKYSIHAGNKSGTLYGNTNLIIEGGNFKASTNTNNINPVYGGSESGNINGNTNVIINGGTFGNHNVYGGCQNGSVTGSATVAINGGNFGSANSNYNHTICAGSTEGDVGGITTLNITGTPIFPDNNYNIYGGSTSGNIGGNTAITIASGSFKNVYSGSASGTMEGIPDITITGGEIRGYVYGKNTGTINQSTFNNLEVSNATVSIIDKISTSKLTLGTSGVLDLKGEATVNEFVGVNTSPGTIKAMGKMIINGKATGTAILEIGKIVGNVTDATTLDTNFPKTSFTGAVIVAENSTNTQRTWTVGNVDSLEVVYVRADGDDTKSGDSYANALKTLKMAYYYLKAADDSNPTIVICGNMTLNNLPENATKKATITSKTENETYNVNITLNQSSTNGFVLGNETTFKDINLIIPSTTTIINTNQNNLAFSDGVTITNGNNYLNISGGTRELNISSGEFNNINVYADEDENTTDDVTINIKNENVKINNINNKADNISNEIKINISIVNANPDAISTITTNFSKQNDTVNISLIRNNEESTSNYVKVNYIGNIEANNFKVGNYITLLIDENNDEMNFDTLDLSAENAKLKITNPNLNQTEEIDRQRTVLLNGNFIGGGYLDLTDYIIFEIKGKVSGTTSVIDEGEDENYCVNTTISATDDDGKNYNYFEIGRVDSSKTYWDRKEGQGTGLIVYSVKIDGGTTIYIHKDGSDSALGIKALPLKTLKRAYEHVNTRYAYEKEKERETGKEAETEYTIVLLTDITLTERKTDVLLDENVIVTITTDNNTQNLKINNQAFDFEGNTKLEKIKIYTKDVKDTNGQNTQVEFFANGYNVTFGKDGENEEDKEDIVMISNEGLLPIVYGGTENATDIVGDTNLTILSGQYDMIFGGDKTGTRIGDITVNYKQGETNRLYGGGYEGNIIDKTTDGRVTGKGNIVVNIGDSEGTGSAKVNRYLRGSGLEGSVVNTEVNLYKGASFIKGTGPDDGTQLAAGGFKGNVNNSKLIVHENAEINCDIHGGGWGDPGIPQYGKSTNATVIINGGTVNGSIFGGGHYGATGTTNVYVAGGTIKGDVYGGGYSSVVTSSVYTGNAPEEAGNTFVKIGKNVLQNITDESIKNKFVYSNITIEGSVFGGGKSNTAGSDNYDFSFISVEKNTNVDIDGKNDTTNNNDLVKIKGSIFASGNAATIGEKGYINISNFGTNENNKIVSIQRADTVTIDNSNIRIKGTTDRTNDNSAALYTLNRIGTLTLKNNSTIYLDNGVNLVQNLNSQNADGSILENIENGVVKQERSTENKIFLQKGKNIILKDEQNIKGTVEGTFFLGQYEVKADDTIEKGIYDGEGNEYFDRASYVQAKEYSDESGKKCFYTYILDNGLNLGIINPTTINGQHTQWIITGKIEDIYYEKELIASKYSVQSQAIIELNELIRPNQILSIGYMKQGEVEKTGKVELATGVKLKSPTKIESIGSNPDYEFGLTMYTGEQGWKDRYETSFTNVDDSDNIIADNGIAIVEDEDIEGKDKIYYSDASENKIPELIFNFVHSKNITADINLGKVTICLNTKDEITEKYTNIIIELNLLTRKDDSTINYYEGAIAPGAKFNVFPSVPTNITKNSDLSIYYSLYLDNSNLSKATDYKDNIDNFVMYHSLTMTNPLPEKTKIILIDKSSGTNEYYYYIVSSVDSSDKKEYKFTEFYKMGTIESSNDKYSNDEKYFNKGDDASSSTDDYVLEEFIVQISFADADITTDYSNDLSVKLKSDNKTENYYSDDKIEYELNTLYNTSYTVHTNRETTKELNSEEIIWNISKTDTNNAKKDVKLSTIYQYATIGGNVVYDTTNFDNKLGLKIIIQDEAGATIKEDFRIIHNTKPYSIEEDGAIRIHISDMVSNINTNLEIDFQNVLEKFETDKTYKLVIQAIGSIDGLSEGNAIATKEIMLNFYDEYGLKVDWEGTNPQNYQIIDKETGKTINGDNNLKFNVKYSGEFANPNIDVKIARRDYTTEYSTSYEDIALRDFFTEEEYNITKTDLDNANVDETTGVKNKNLTMVLKNKLKSGTYKIKFILNDAVVDSEGNVTGNNKISEVYKMIIIK